MNRIITLAFLLMAGLSAKAQSYPMEWSKYANEGYFFDIESSSNTQQTDEAKFRNDLLDLARANLSKQIQVRVEEVSQLDKTVDNGNTDIQYSSSRRFTTNLDLKLAKTESHTDMVTGKVFVIAYINKQEACQYYEKELQMLLSKTNNAFQIAEDYVQQGFKPKAKTELQQALDELDLSEELFFWFNIFGFPELELGQYLAQVHQVEQNLKSKIAELEYGTTYCVICTAELFGEPYPRLEKEVKGQLSASGYNFTDEPASADYVIYVEAVAREYNKADVAGTSVYFAYVDAVLSIKKNATGQRIFEDEFSIKGSHTISYEEAARDGYKKVSKEISKLLKENIIGFPKVEQKAPQDKE